MNLPTLATAWLRHRSLSAAAAVLVLACSTVTLIARYDEDVDSRATALARQMDVFLTNLESATTDSARSFAGNQKFYDSYAIDLRALLLRTEAIPKNEKTAEQVKLMMQNVDQLKAAHEAGPIDPAAIPTFRDLFAQGWKAILTLELAKPREGQ